MKLRESRNRLIVLVNEIQNITLNIILQLQIKVMYKTNVNKLRTTKINRCDAVSQKLIKIILIRFYKK